MKKYLLCTPNISEGTDQDKIKIMTEALKSTPEIKVLTVNPDKDHNRISYHFIGSPKNVLEGAKRLSDKAIDLIDMTKHKGSHPRMGAIDVVPFIPIRNVDKEEAVEIARQYGKYLGNKGIPVYYHEDAATRPERKKLANIRKGQYEALEEKLKDEFWRPDEGPFEFIPKSGVTATGVRMPLVAFNINLNTTNLDIGKVIAKQLRFSSGGLRYCRAIALPLEDKKLVQVSINIDDYRNTPIPVVLDFVKSMAGYYGVNVVNAEFAGSVPLEALKDVVRYSLQVHDFEVSRIIESNLID